MRFYKTWLLALAVVLAAIVAAARPAAAQDGAVRDPDFIDSQRLGAQVTAAGALGANIGGVSATRLGVGTYEVIFNRNVVPCAYKGTMGNNGFGATTGEIGLVGRATNANGVFVTTYNSAGALTDRTFFVLVACP